jgi:hypothetical protein
MNERRGDPDERLTSWLRQSHAELDPAIFARVRARLGREPAQLGWLSWLTRPAALATSVAALVLATTLSYGLIAGARDTAIGSESENGLTDALLSVGSSPVDQWLVPATESGDAAADSGATP